MTRVLLVRPSAMGDVVQSLGAIAALHEARPDFELHLLTQRTWAPLARGVLGITSVVEHDRRGGLAAVWRTARALRALRCTVALDLQGNTKSALFAWLSRARERIGAAARWRQEPWSRVLLTRTVAIEGPRHPALVAQTIVRCLAPEAPERLPRLFAEPAEVERVAARVRALGIDPAAPFRVVSVGRREDPRSQRQAALARELASSPLPVLALLGPGEADVEVPALVPVLRQEPGQVRDLVALGALLAQCGGDAVSPDQGPAHVLTAAGASVTVLFGPQDPACTAPPAARAVRHPDPPSCLPCRSSRCRHELGPVCMAFASTEGRPVPSPCWLRGDASTGC